MRICLASQLKQYQYQIVNKISSIVEENFVPKSAHSGLSISERQQKRFNSICFLQLWKIFRIVLILYIGGT